MVDPARYQEPPLPVAPTYPPRLYIPPVHPKSTCIRVCGGENPHNVDVARPWTQPGAERRRMASASRGRPGATLTTSSEEAASSWRVPGRSITVSAEHEEETERARILVSDVQTPRRRQSSAGRVTIVSRDRRLIQLQPRSPEVDV